MTKPWPLVPLGEILRQRREMIRLDDLQPYNRVRVKLHAQGIVLRDQVNGAEIKTKDQQVCKTGDFLVAEIDAKLGGYGIVPNELEGAIVSSHYFLFEINPDRLDCRFLGYFIRMPAFLDQVCAQGSTNYAAIRPSHVLGYQIPLPPLPEQRRIADNINKLAAKINEARTLRQQGTKQNEALIVSTHVQLAGTRKRKLGDILKLDEDVVQVLPDGQYPQVGVKSFGAGLFAKPPVAGTDTTYKIFNRLYSGALVLSQVKGWEGAVAVCGSELASKFVSPEYRTFRCITGEANPGYLSALVRTEWFWRKLTHATRGVGARRERTRPEQFLEIELPMPDIDLQRKGQALFTLVDELKRHQTETVAGIDAVMPSILNKAFKGQL